MGSQVATVRLSGADEVHSVPVGAEEGFVDPRGAVESERARTDSTVCFLLAFVFIPVHLFILNVLQPCLNDRQCGAD